MKVLKGKEIPYNLIEKLDKLDNESYDKQYLEEDLFCKERFVKENEQYIILLDDSSEEPVGYINFFPTTTSLKNDIIVNQRFRDVDITGKEVDNWSESNDVFILSLVIGEKYRCRENVQLLFDEFIKFLNEKEKQGKKINSVYCITVSKDGEKVFKRKMFRVIGKIKDNEHIREVSGKQLRLFLEGEEYYKSYSDDFFMFIPYVGTESTLNLIKGTKHNLEAQNFINKIVERMNYEYNEEFVNELSFGYLGKINLLSTYDIYDDDYIVENTEAFMVLISHKQSNMHVLALNIIDNKISPTLLADRLSQDKLIIYKDNKILNLNNFINKKYGLVKSGNNRLLDFMNKKPEDKEEIFNLLSSESYNSTIQQFSLNTDDFIENKRDITEAYDTYNIYTSERSVILVADGDEVLEDKEELISVYYSLVVFAIFQNISLHRITEKITKQLSETGDLSYSELTSTYRDYALAAGFWDLDEFKYISTKKEAEIIEKSFGNLRMYDKFKEKLRFIDQVTDLNEARNDRNTNIILGLLALFLAIFETQDAVLALINAFVSNFSDIELNGVQFDTGVIIIVLIALIVFKISSKRRNNK